MYGDGVSSTVSAELRARVISDHNHRTIEIISRLIIFIAWCCARAVYVCLSVAEMGLLRFNGFQNGAACPPFWIHWDRIAAARSVRCRLFVCVSRRCIICVSVYVTTAGPAQKAEQIELPFGRNGQNVQH